MRDRSNSLNKDLPNSSTTSDGRIESDSDSNKIQEIENYEELLMRLRKADELADSKMKKMKTFEKLVHERIKDNSPAARRDRLRRTIRAAIGEFCCTILFLFPMMATNINGHLKGYNPDIIALSTSLVAGFSAVAVCFSFSSVSGANFNPAISLALGVVRKMSKRRVAMFIFAQLLASVVSVSLAVSIFNLENSTQYTTFTDLFFFLSHADDDGANNTYVNSKIFGTEFITTFLFTYIIFLVAFEDAEKAKRESMSVKQIADSAGLVVYTTTPNSNTAFVPFIVGFTLFSLSLTGGASGSVFNPAALFGPALVCNQWNHIPLMMTGEFLGSISAAIVVRLVHNFAADSDIVSNEVSANSMQELELTEVETETIRESLRK
jgi:glycerol uptake facilitator-like aquaporin